MTWSRATLEKLGLDRVYTQPVWVPHWVRGAKEKASLTAARGSQQEVDVCALGGSVGTPGPLRAGVVEVRSWAELAALPDSRASSCSSTMKYAELAAQAHETHVTLSAVKRHVSAL